MCSFLRETLAFGTEPVFASVANVLGCYDNLPNPKPKLLQDFKLYEVEIKYGLLQVNASSRLANLLLCFLT